MLRWHLIYLGSRRDVTVNTVNGVLTFDSKDWLVGKYLYVKRNHEAQEIRGFINLLRAKGYLDDSISKATALNVGANIGMTCIGLLKLGGFDRAIAFEPAPSSYRLLIHTIKQNNLDDRIRHFQLALSSIDGELDLEISADNSEDN